MPSSTLDHGSLESGPRVAALIVGMLAGPVVWATLLETNYVLSYVACQHRAAWILYVPAAAGLALIAGAAFAVWRAAPLLSGAKEGQPAEEDAPSIDPRRTALFRARFMETFALASCAFFALVIIATEIPVLVLHPCAW